MANRIKSSPLAGASSYDESGTVFSPDELRVLRMDTVSANRATLTKDTYFESGGVIVCYAGRFRFSFTGESAAIEMRPGETLVLYPGSTVTIAATQDASHLGYVLFGGTRVEDFFDGFGFYDRLKFSGCTQKETFDTALRLSATDLSKTMALLRIALETFAHHLQSGDKGRCYRVLHAIERGIRAGKPRLKDVCNDLGISRATLNRCFAAMGLGSPSAYIANLQFRRALRLIKMTEIPFAEIAKIVGIATPAHFTAFIRARAHASPTTLRHKA